MCFHHKIFSPISGQTCPSCNGAGGWDEDRGTPGFPNVVWVGCKYCGGTGVRSFKYAHNEPRLIKQGPFSK